MSTKELPTDINQKIQEEAKCHSEGKNYDSVRYASYFTGATAWARIAIGFAEWVDDRYIQDTPGKWYSYDNFTLRDDKNTPHFTTDVILIEYIKTLAQ